MLLLFKVIGGLFGAALLARAAAGSHSSASSNPGAIDLAAWASDLAELPDDPPGAGLRSETAQYLANATPDEIPALRSLADGLDQQGYHNAARRIRIRIQELGG